MEIKVYLVSGDDYSALSFKNDFRSRLMSEVAKELGVTEQSVYTVSRDDAYYEVSLHDVITDEKSYNVGKSLQDYDDSKHQDLILETETL